MTSHVAGDGVVRKEVYAALIIIRALISSYLQCRRPSQISIPFHFASSCRFYTSAQRAPPPAILSSYTIRLCSFALDASEILKHHLTRPRRRVPLISAYPRGQFRHVLFGFLRAAQELDHTPRITAIHGLDMPRNQVEKDTESGSDSGPSLVGQKRIRTEYASPVQVEYTANGLRKVKPYWYNYATNAKGRWLGREILEVISTEFRDRSMEYYVSHAFGFETESSEYVDCQGQRYALESGVTTINGKVARPDTIVQNGDRIEYAYIRTVQTPVILTAPSTEMLYTAMRALLLPPQSKLSIRTRSENSSS